MVSRDTYRDGGRTLVSVDVSSANDLGEYRLSGLAPGRYFVSAQQREWTTVTGDSEFTVGDKQGDKGYIKT